jgi:hypothetical protein
MSLTLRADRRERCPHCGVVLHTIKGVTRHYGSEGACLRIRELEMALTDACIALSERWGFKAGRDPLMARLRDALEKGIPDGRS